MRELLTQNNAALCAEIEQLQRILNEERHQNPAELNAYSEWVANKCEDIYQRILQNLKDLDTGEEALIKDILSSTRLTTQDFYFLDAHRVSPIVRAQTADRLSLKMLQWLHTTHPKTKSIPAALQDGEFSIWLIEPIIYFTPCTSQRGLLNLPLLCHEFGHLLYACHQSEMDALVNELQVSIDNLLQNTVKQNDKETEEQTEKRDVIVDRWYEWAQECFCDAVGFVIGGPAFTYAFSMYLRMLGPNQYHMPPEKLAQSVHPVTWMRIRLLAERARKMGYNPIATDLEEKWQQVADALGIAENYDGFYDETFLPIIQQKLDKMLAEATPRQFQKSEVLNPETASLFNSPVALLNTAWKKLWDEPEAYRAWEENAIAKFLETEIWRQPTRGTGPRTTEKQHFF